MFSPQKANLRLGEVTGAGLVKLFKPGEKQRDAENPGSATQARKIPVWKVWGAVLGFLALLVVVSVFAAKLW
jgi:hypothetical protein